MRIDRKTSKTCIRDRYTLITVMHVCTSMHVCMYVCMLAFMYVRMQASVHGRAKK